MNQEPDNFSQRASKMVNEAAAFQKIWGETFTKMMQAGFTISPESAPPELMHQMRGGIFRALAESWEEFLRMPQFLEGMKQWMESSIGFRQMTNEYLTRFRHELQAPSREDVETIMLTVRHMERRILDRLEEVSAEVAELKQQLGSNNGAATPATPAAARAAAPGRGAKTPRNPKTPAP